MSAAAAIDSAPAPRVLVIDDEPHIRKFIDISLRSQGYRTLLAATGQEGLSMLGEGADIVVLDLGLPDRDGEDVLKELRRWSRVPVIVLTVRSDEEGKSRCSTPVPMTM
ncbi:DNA-binding response regulator OS=Rhodanobacter lindaniclasticus OX=75310 GN=B1991_04595 PE=4 SV=1 [Rhodanobacter lindaniclasticus]